MPRASMPQQGRPHSSRRVRGSVSRTQVEHTAQRAADSYDLVLTCILLDRVLDRTTATQHSTLPVNLVVRESTAAPHR